MIAFIDDHRGAHGVEPICKVLPIAPSTYHDHVAKRADPTRLSARARSDVALKDEMRRVFEENFRVYGVRKVWRQLQREGFDVARCTVARLMRRWASRASSAASRSGPRSATRPHHARSTTSTVSSMLRRRTCSGSPTSPTSRPGPGFVYVAFVIDAYARRIVGWRVSRTAHAAFVLDALEQALHDRRPVHRGGLVHHSRQRQPIRLRFNTPSAWPRPASSLRSAASATATTTLSPKRSTVSTRPRSSIDADRGVPSRPSSSRHWNGSTGSTIAGCWSPSATSRRPKPRSATTPCWMNQPWPHNFKPNSLRQTRGGSVIGAVRNLRQAPSAATPCTVVGRFP